MSKVLQVFYGQDNLPYKDQERQVHFPIVGNSFQGASNTTEIRFYYEQILSYDIGATWVAIAKLPNGKIGSQILSENTYDSELQEHYVKLDLSSFYTQAIGDLYISLQGYRDGVQVEYNSETQIYDIVGTPVIEATGSIKLAINYSTQPVGSDISENITIQEFLGVFASKLDKNSHFYLKVVSTIGSINTNTYKDFVSSGDIVYTIDSGKFYIISGTYPSLTYVELSLNPSTINTSDIIVNDEIRVVKGISYLTFGQNGLTSLQDYLDEKVSKENDLLPTYTASMNDKVMDFIRNNEITYLLTACSFVLKVQVNSTTDQYSYICNIQPWSSTQSIMYLFLEPSTVYWVMLENTSNEKFSDIIAENQHKMTFELKENKVTSLSSSSTDTQYPSAKCVYDNLELKADKSNTYTKSEIDTKLTSMLVYKGSKTVAELNALSPTLGEIQTGWFYNVTDSGVLNAGNVEVLSGDNVAWTGSSWDKLTMDLTQYNETFLAAGFLQASPIDSVPDTLTFDDNGDITNPNWTGNIDIDYMSPPITDISISQVPDTLNFDLTQNYDNMITNADWTGIMTITY